MAIDGKTVRGSGGGNAPVHLISALVSEALAVLAQLPVAGKSNEIKAIPDLLALLDIQGSTVTIEAMGAQKAIAAPIVEGGADYVLALKANHQNWYEEVTLRMNTGYDAGQLSVLETVAKDHGRLETRRYTLSTRRDWLDGRANWAGLNALGMVESRREIGAKDRNEVASSTVPPIPPCFV